jgi:DNA-binding transcriptional regulator GbsR (MarR family)
VVSPTQDERHEALLRYVERFAALLRESGMPPMPARVFAYALADDADRYTAADLAEGLRVSPAAVSGAVRYLIQVGLLGRDRQPGSHGGVYYLYSEDVWYHIYRGQLARLHRFRDVAAEGVTVLGEDTPGGARLRETAEFFAFLDGEYEALMERWHSKRTTSGPDTV